MVKATCPVRGGLGGTPLLKSSKDAVLHSIITGALWTQRRWNHKDFHGGAERNTRMNTG